MGGANCNKMSSSTVESVHSSVFCLSRAQASIQAYLRPGIWLPGIRTPHIYRETWTMEESSAEVFAELIRALESVQYKERLEVSKVKEDEMFIQAISFTPHCNWLDVMEIQVDNSLLQSETTVYVRGFSSGVFPVCIPLSFVWNSMFCWLPFGDVGMNQRRIRGVREALNLTVNIEVKGRTC